mgnify:CR=1 FL=1
MIKFNHQKQMGADMWTIDEVEVLLNEVAEELPEAFYNELNGGIFLLPEEKPHPNSRYGATPLFIMGEYHRNAHMGRYIVVYYGSLMRVNGLLSPEEMKKELRKIIRHEFTHHLESLAGERGLEIKDEENLDKYLNNLKIRVFLL